MGEPEGMNKETPADVSVAGECQSTEQFERADESSTHAAAETDEPGRSGDTGWADEKLLSVLESLLFAAGEPVSLSQLANAIEEVPRERIRKTLSEMAATYASGRCGLLLEEIAGGYQLRTRSEHAVYVRRLLSTKAPRLSRPVLETLAIVAYRQPVTRPEIEQLRGVDSGGVLDTLIERSLIKIAGRKEGPGRPIMYTTTSEFLELFGLKNLESLPDLEEFRELEGLRTADGARSAEATQDVNSESQPDSEFATQSLPIEDVPNLGPDETRQANQSESITIHDTASIREADEAQNPEDNGESDD
jgi:segregation and condensation protein B